MAEKAAAHGVLQAFVFMQPAAELIVSRIVRPTDTAHAVAITSLQHAAGDLLHDANPFRRSVRSVAIDLVNSRDSG